MARPAKKADTSNVNDVVEYLQKHRGKVLAEERDKTPRLTDEGRALRDRYFAVLDKITSITEYRYSRLPSSSRIMASWMEKGHMDMLESTTYDVAEVNEILDSVGPKFRAALWNNLRQKRKERNDSRLSSNTQRQITITTQALVHLGIAKEDLGVNSYSEAIIKLREFYVEHEHLAK